ncbi:AMO-like protein [Mya arenaria]|uniref:Amine oxidase n=1 Tax=Mya arenaria TaxID=6604 RepID=A0ABY7DSQ4_MYAAR|nr:AMO-like protein [Mya arenaria]
MLNAEVGGKMNDILMECYGGRIEDCSDNCLEFQMVTPMASRSTGEEFRRKMWFWLGPTVEYFPLHALDFLVRVDLTSSKTSDYYIDQIYHANQSFYSVDELVRSYDAGDFVKTSIKYANTDRNLFSSMNRRGTLFPTEPLSPPLQYEPDGKRYSIEGRHVNYMGWDFDVRMSTLSGPQLWNIKYNDNRIVYELSLQEIAVFYSAFSPGMRFADYVDSVAQIGTRARSLVAGADCPAHSTFLSAYHVIESQEDPMVVDRAFCVFELNTGMPLRRHLTSSGKNKFYEGMMDIVLTVRTIATVANYDYIFDFVFHQNGALEVKATSTGYILTSFRFPSEDEYGFRLKDHLTGNIHHHMFHYKVDMDINGRENRFETIEIVPTEVDNSQWSKEKDAKYSQTKIVRKTMGYEKTAVIDFKFSTPKLLTFYKDTANSLGVPKAYRLLVRGMSKQLAVTKYKEDERKPSSIYACWDANRPVVNFQSFIDDNDVIKDVDQVTWVTMGVHHIPHTEDLPVTPTVGLDLRFLLLPFNYFHEDPAMGSGDAVRIEPNNQEHASQGLHVERYGRPENPAKSSFYQNIENKPESLF